MQLNQDQVIADLKDHTLRQKAYLNDQVQPLSEEVLNRKPGEKQWSMLECLQHLNIIGDIYLEGFRRKCETGRSRQSEQYKTGWLGNYAAKSMLPKKDGKLRFKMKALAFMHPQSSTWNKEEVLSTHRRQLEDFIGLLAKAPQVDLGENRVATSLGAWLTFTLGDAMRFYVNHQDRHYLQLQRTAKVVT